MPNGVEFEGRLAHVGTFPIGIQPESFIDVCPSPNNCIVSMLKVNTFEDFEKTNCEGSN